MPRHYLFGPVTPLYADQNLYRHRQARQCLAFDEQGATDLAIGQGDAWESICARLPDGWQPDFIVLQLAYTTIPPALWKAPVPLIGLASDWNLLWHHYRRQLRRCDLVLTDAAGVDVMAREGISHACAAVLFGCERAFLESPRVEATRDIDILFVGNLNAPVQRERLPWLGRLARLRDRWRVVIETNVFGDAYRQLLRRARIVFNRSIRQECNLRAFEAAASGALLFQEAENREVRDYFQDQKECVYYTSDNLEALLNRYLTHEEERRALAEAAAAKVQKYEFANLWDEHLGLIEREWSGIEERSRHRPVWDEDEDLLSRTWQRLTSVRGRDPTLVAHLETALQREPQSAGLHNALGLVVTAGNPVGTRLPRADAERGKACFQRALASDPNHLLAGLNLTETFIVLGEIQPALEQARRTLSLLDQPGLIDTRVWEAGHFPPCFEYFRVGWEQAAWRHAGQPAAEAEAKKELLRGRLHIILAEGTEDLAHFAEAARACPEWPPLWAAFGCALARSGRFADAIGHLRQAVAMDPFDGDAARAAFQALLELHDVDGQRQLVRERRLLAETAPCMVSLEHWFRDPTPPASAEMQLGQQATPKRFQTLSPEEFGKRYGTPDTTRAIHSFTKPGDTHAILTLLAYARPRRILEIGTAQGHMTANFTEWSPDDAAVFTLGLVADQPGPKAGPQGYEIPHRAAFGCCANHFGKAHKVFFITADSLHYNFRRLTPLDFAFIDGAHDLQHVLNDTLRVYEVLRPGGCIVWHDFDSTVAWVEVRKALEQAQLAETIYHVAGTEVAFLRKQSTVDEAKRLGGRSCVGQDTGPTVFPVPDVVVAHGKPLETPSLAAGTESAHEPLGIVWEGAQEETHSLALVNREICLRLIRRGHELAIRPSSPQTNENHRASIDPLLGQRFHRSVSRSPTACVRHSWPPDLAPPQEGHWVFFQPWEFGSIPRKWIEVINQQVDEVWAYTHYVRDCYVQSGVPPDRVQVIPLGVACERFHPQVPPLPLKTTKPFKFLFVGGTIHRKGIDLLLIAYAEAFSRTDPVCLVIKDMGIKTFYQGQTAGDRIAQLQAQGVEIEYIDRILTDEELAGLYTACNCLVHPYRGEGFGLPIAEAMASGLPVIVTGAGAALDFCTNDNAFLIPAKVTRLSQKRVGDLETVDYPWLVEPDLQALTSSLRYVVENPGEARSKGRAAMTHIRSRFTWEHSAAAAESRLRALRQRPIRRLCGLNGKNESGIPAVPRVSRPRVSLTMIVRNEETNLPTCLKSAADLVDEVIVVDTGSTDGTKAIAQRLGAKVHEFPWVDSFAAARNEALRHATGDWAFWLDADDRLDDENRKRLRRLFASLQPQNVAYAMKCLCLPDPKHKTSTVVDHVRLFRNHPQIRWRYRVHEQILPAIRSQGGTILTADVTIHHAGYQDLSLRSRKHERDLRLLELDHAEHPEDPFILFNIGWVYTEKGQPGRALPLLQGSLKRSNPGDSIVRKLFSLIIRCQRRLGRTEEALKTCQRGRVHYPDDVELLFQEGLLRRERGDLAGAKACYFRLLESHEVAQFASVDTGLAGYKTRHNLAIVFQAEGQLAEAEAQWRAAVTEEPSFAPAWFGLGAMYLGQERWTDLDWVLARLDEGCEESIVLRAQRLMVRKEAAAARRLLEASLAALPDAVVARNFLSHILLREARDWVAAERVVREILTLDPANAEAKANLTAIRRQMGPETGASMRALT